jgi:hypothetical protein
MLQGAPEPLDMVAGNGRVKASYNITTVIASISISKLVLANS